MLQRLSVSNFAIINELNLSFGRGLTIITGETGAGKSILLGALRLILGERADLKQLNDPGKKCVVEAVFDISNLNLNSFLKPTSSILKMRPSSGANFCQAGNQELL